MSTLFNVYTIGCTEVILEENKFLIHISLDSLIVFPQGCYRSPENPILNRQLPMLDFSLYFCLWCEVGTTHFTI